MSTGAHGPAASELPTFSQCVIGYRRWQMDDRGRLWPLWMADRPWEPGVNVARCPCGSWTSLRFTYRTHGGRVVLEPEADHAAPAGECTCGLYSWRRPPDYWHEEAKWSTPPRVVGAVASWGRMQVHRDGFRAEFACIVTLAWHPDISTAGLNVLDHLARDYRAELVEMDRLEEAARRHGSPLADTFGPQAPEPHLTPRATRALLAVPRPPKRDLRTALGFLLLGVICCAAAIAFYDPKFVGSSGGPAHEAPRRSNGPMLPSLFGLIGGLGFIATGLWFLWLELDLDIRLAQWQVRRRAKAAAGRSARSRAAPRP